MLLFIECLNTIASIFILAELSLIFLGVELWVCLPRRCSFSLQNIDYGGRGLLVSKKVKVFWYGYCVPSSIASDVSSRTRPFVGLGTVEISIVIFDFSGSAILRRVQRKWRGWGRGALWNARMYDQAFYCKLRRYLHFLAVSYLCLICWIYPFHNILGLKISCSLHCREGEMRKLLSSASKNRLSLEKDWNYWYRKLMIGVHPTEWFKIIAWRTW